MDCYDEYEARSGWQCYLEDEIVVPQDAMVGKKPARLLRVVPICTAVHASMQIGDLKITVPIETVRLKNKKQNEFILAYKEWMGD